MPTIRQALLPLIAVLLAAGCQAQDVDSQSLIDHNNTVAALVARALTNADADQAERDSRMADLIARSAAAGTPQEGGGARVAPILHAETTCEALGRADAGCGGLLGLSRSLDIEPVTAANRPALVALHDAEPLRFDWSPQWQHVALPSLLETEVGSGWLVRREGRPVAALCIYSQVHERWGPQLVDWFGDRRAVVAALPQVMRRLGLERLRMAFSMHDAALGQACAAAGIEASPVYPSGWTIRVLDVPGLLDAFEPLLRERFAAGDAAAAEGDRLRLSSGGAEWLAPDIRASTAVVFGTERARREAAGDMPPQIADLAARVFPVPMRHYGLNYL